MVPAVVYALLFGIVQLEEQSNIILFIEVGQSTEAGVREQHFQEYVPRVHVLWYVGDGFVLVAADVQASWPAGLLEVINRLFIHS